MFQEFLQNFFDVIFPTFIERLLFIIKAPITYPGMVWILFPMIVTLLLMTFYFGRYRREELGWNTAVGNALVLLFVSIDLLQKVYPEQNPIRALTIFLRTLFQEGFTATGILPGIIAGAILVYALVLLTADFFHWLPKKLAFFISSGLPLNILSYFGIIFVYSSTSGTPIALDWYTFFAFFTLFSILYILLHILQLAEPHKDDEDDDDDKKKKIPFPYALNQDASGDVEVNEDLFDAPKP